MPFVDTDYHHARVLSMEASYTYLTTEELASRIKYDCRTIRQCLKDTVLLEGKHYIKPFGRRKILFLWEAVEKEMLAGSREEVLSIPMAAGGVCHG
ncbi:MAG: hypothetical protein L0J62_11840 [Corynebacterium casei]|uniref:hypothetical protein n=1 Tax=Corynebacterium casei TaxID=160386 RepID=UPI00264A2A52|nr:hypothetical protein [Corynebacterium casei]MDN6286360.1 hypothetical protein [Corynebacterium casei]